LQQCGSMFSLFFGLKKVRCKEDLKQLDERRFIHFFKYLFKRGIYFSPSSHEACFISSAHTEEHIHYTADAIVSYIYDCS